MGIVSGNIRYGQVICPKCELDDTSEKIVYYGGDFAYCKKCKSTFSIVLLTNTPEIKNDDPDFIKCPGCNFPAYRINGKKTYNCQKCKSTFVNEEVRVSEKTTNISNENSFKNDGQRKDLKPPKIHTGTIKQPRQNKVHPIFGLVSLGFVIFCIISFNKSCDDSKQEMLSEEKRDNEIPTNSEAFIISKNFVKDNIVAPSTADFPIEPTNVKFIGNKYIIFSYLDAQNSFGAKIREKYICYQIYNGGEWNSESNWTLMSLVIGDDIAYINKNKTEQEIANDIDYLKTH